MLGKPRETPAQRRIPGIMPDARACPFMRPLPWILEPHTGGAQERGGGGGGGGRGPRSGIRRRLSKKNLITPGTGTANVIKCAIEFTDMGSMMGCLY